MNIVCACMQIDEETIVAKVKAGFDTVEKIQEETTAGTGCGGCISAIEELIEKNK
ncbi:(2Fe-2S)-binding protein [Mycoplasmatota bacterium WC44]